MSASMEIPESSSINNSEQDFFVISESPVVQLSEGDILDGLEVPMESFTVGSISLKDDIERLTRENEQLKETALNDGEAMKKHLQVCTEYKEQMVKCHERDAAMLEQARKATLNLQRENTTLITELEQAKQKIGDAMVAGHNLRGAKFHLERQLNSLRKENAYFRKQAEEAEQKAEEASFVHIESGPTKVEEELQAELAQLKAKYEGESSKALVAAPDTSEGESARGENELAAAVEAVSRLERDVCRKDGEIDVLKEQVATLKAELVFAAPVDENDVIAALQAELLEAGQREMDCNETLDGRTADLTEIKFNWKIDSRRNDLLSKKITVLKEERRKLQEQKKKIEGAQSQLIKDHTAAMASLQTEHASQIEALKMALRYEQGLREKSENAYSNLLQTWQGSERRSNRSCEVPEGHSADQNSIERVAEEVAVADRLSLEADNRSLRDTIRELQTQNMRLLGERQPDPAQQASVSRSAKVERKCPICMQHFNDQYELIVHAGMCGTDLASLD